MWYGDVMRFFPVFSSFSLSVRNELQLNFSQKRQQTMRQELCLTPKPISVYGTYNVAGMHDTVHKIYTEYALLKGKLKC